MNKIINRRTLMKTGLTVGAVGLSNGASSQSAYSNGVIQKHDEQVERLLGQQITDKKNRWFGGYPNHYGLVNPHSAGHVFEMFTAAYLCSQSKYFHNSTVKQRIQFAVEHLLNAQNEYGNIDLLTTNFNSPPDTGFVVHRVASGARIAQLLDETEIVKWIEPFLKHAGQALAVGGIHTPNHRWVVCAALAQINELFPDDSYTDRIDQWLAENIDIDEDGMYSERSTTVYNAVTNNALVTVAAKLNKDELLGHVRKNLNAMQYLLHANGEVVTEISRRQDVNTQGDMQRYWFSLRYMAVHDQDGKYTAMLKWHEPERIHLPHLMEYPILNQPLPDEVALPVKYQKVFESSGITRIRDGKLSATLIHKGSSRFFSLHYGTASINAVRFATAFFGKGQFIPEDYAYHDGVHTFKQSLRGPYYQPIEPSRTVSVDGESIARSRLERKQTEVCIMNYEVQLRRNESGFDIRMKADGTDNVPVSVEINLRDGGTLDGVEKVEHTQNSWVLPSGMAVYSVGNDKIKFGPGRSENTYVQVSGAQEKLSGQSVYITAYTPFSHTIRFELS